MNVATPTSIPRRRLLCGCAGLAALGMLAACGRGDERSAAAAPLEPDRSTSCTLDGMLLADYPGPKGQLHFAGAPQVEWTCDSLELLALLLRPEQARLPRAVWVQDMAKADWDHPVGHWIDARSAFYVLGSRRKGSMGATAASFASAADAQAFAAAHGGKVVPFADVRPEMVDLSGGALHDTRM
jgi:copper chaperone NosL